MASPINYASYTNLFGPPGYSVLAQTGITSAATTTINNGFYGTPAGVGISGTFAGTATRNDSTTSATTDLTALVGAINAVTPVFAYPGGPNTFSPGIKYTAGGVISPSGILNFEAGGNPDAQFFIVAGTGISFTGTSLTINLNDGAQAKNIFWLSNSSAITTDANIPTIQGNLIGGSSVTIAGLRTINGSIFAQTGNVTFAANTTVNGSIICYLKGTKILTENGYVCIEDLNIGDKVVSMGKIRDNAYLEPIDNFSLEPITWIGNFKAPNLNTDSLPICIKADALGTNSPTEDLYVSPGHRIIINNEMICARDLINGTTIFQDNDRISIHYYHFEVKDHASIIANGVLSESYMDINTRCVFDNNTVNEVKLAEPIFV